MKANLISVSQLCDDDLDAHFDKRRFYVVREDGECIITGKRTYDNYYQMNTVIESICMEVKLHDTKLWQRRLGHINYKLLHKLGSKAIVEGIPCLVSRTKLYVVIFNQKSQLVSQIPK